MYLNNLEKDYEELTKKLSTMQKELSDRKKDYEASESALDEIAHLKEDEPITCVSGFGWSFTLSRNTMQSLLSAESDKKCNRLTSYMQDLSDFIEQFHQE